MGRHSIEGDSGDMDDRGPEVVEGEICDPVSDFSGPITREEILAGEREIHEATRRLKEARHAGSAVVPLPAVAIEGAPDVARGVARVPAANRAEPRWV